jgi:AcrR family transcriptional regulator
MTNNLSFQVKVNPNLHERDPQSSELGKKILMNSVILMDELGFEGFTFKKLAERIQSTEASIYRYFENKHLLLVYLMNLYWEGVRMRLEVNLLNVSDPKEKLLKILSVIINSSQVNLSIENVDEDVLHKIVILEGYKAYHGKNVDADNALGFFNSFKELSERISEVILEVNPNFKYPRTTATMLLDLANSSVYNAMHLPRLTDLKKEQDVVSQSLTMLSFYIDKLITVK